MYYEKQGPHMRVFDGADGKLYYLTKHRNNKTTFHIEKSPGSIVVSLCETDFTEYKNKINELKEIPYSFDKFQALKDQVWNICDMLKPLNEKLYFFTHNAVYLIFDKLINIKHPSELFVLEDKRKREYCYRIYKDGKTCKEVGHTNTYKKSLGGKDSPLKIGQRLYNKLFSRMDRARNKLPEQLTDKDMTEEEFFEWSKIYSSAKADYKNGLLTGEEFIEKIWRD